MQQLSFTRFGLLVGTGILGPAALSQSQAPNDSPFPVRVSDNGRHLVDARGAPFLLQGDTAWSLLVGLTKEEAEEFLENRRRKGFNSLTGVCS
ncbi:MAG: hypothetical protein COZ05_12575 [Armatimonadetes bacterium CG_4_10_14_3_um_filter_59_10]|nr:MAG: hypothetical protein COZ05_12575 [Armatimonadetes bacterium CG_4_10_14_3_um_filter_59_10]